MPKILIVDETESLCNLYRDTLSGQGYKVCQASRGKMAITLVENEKPDLVLLDVLMPDLNGLEVLDYIRRNPETESTKVILLTALSDEATKEKAKKIGANDYIVKSECSMAEILQRIDRVLAR